VLIALPEDASAAQVAATQARRSGWSSVHGPGEDFSALARELSDASDARKTGGQFGLRPADRYPALFVEASRDMAAGRWRSCVPAPASMCSSWSRSAISGMPATTVDQTLAAHILLRPSAQLSESAGPRAA
jgi:peptidyl-prolyl cis-trans isomerase SurA